MISIFKKLIDLLLIAGLAGVAVLVVLMNIEQPVVRLLLGVPLVLVCPGYALAAALFPVSALRLWERAAFALGLSVACAVIGGFLIYVSPFQIVPDIWAWSLGSVTWLGCVAAVPARLRYRQKHPEFAAPSGRWALPFGIATRFVVAGCLVAAAVWVSFTSEAWLQQQSQFTQFWMVYNEEDMLRYAEELARTAAEQNVAVADLPEEEVAEIVGPDLLWVGLYNYESQTTDYIIKVQHIDEVLAYWPDIQLAPGEVFEKTLRLPADAALDESPIEGLLYRRDAPDVVYRRVFLYEQ